MGGEVGRFECFWNLVWVMRSSGDGMVVVIAQGSLHGDISAKMNQYSTYMKGFQNMDHRDVTAISVGVSALYAVFAQR